jgi:hypothetical protein
MQQRGTVHVNQDFIETNVEAPSYGRVEFIAPRTEKFVSGSTPEEMRYEMNQKPSDPKLKEKYLNKISLYLKIDSKFGKLGLGKESGLGLKISNLYKTVQEIALKDKTLTIYQEEVEKKSKQSKGQQMDYTGQQMAYTGQQMAYTGQQMAYTGQQMASTGQQMASTGQQMAYAIQQMAHPSQQMGNTTTNQNRVNIEKLMNLRKENAVELSALDVLTNEEIRDFNSRIDKHDQELIPNLTKLKTQIHSDLEKAGIINKQSQILGKTNKSTIESKLKNAEGLEVLKLGS